MNRIELEKKRRESLNRLDRAYKPKINAVEVDINNSFVHELAKFLAVWLIRKGFPPEDLPSMLNNLSEYKSLITGFLSLSEPPKQKIPRWKIPQVVTEARFKNGKRADIYILDTGQTVEIETNPKRAKRHREDVIVILV